jgi:hypothetical protein
MNQYQTYDELIKMVTEFRLEHRNLKDDELDKLVKRTFRIDQTTLRDISGTTDLITLQTTPIF